VTSFTVVYDASVLYPAPLRDFLMWLALADLFQARWTNEIHQEWIRNVLKNRPDLTLIQLDRTKNLMNSHVRDALITGYEPLIPTLILPDINDRHVLAAAIHGRADFIVTFNLKDFPTSLLADYGVEAIHPDEFVLDLLDLDSAKVCQAVLKQRKTLKNPPLTLEQYLDILIRQGLPQSAIALRKRLKD
jgi:predicted nucleic acid-binding protein